MARARKRRKNASAPVPCGGREPQQGIAQGAILDRSRRGKRAGVDRLRGRRGRRGLSRHRRLQDAHFGHGAIAEMTIDPLEDLPGAVLHLDRARTIDAKNEDRAFLPSSLIPNRLTVVVPVARPDHSVGHRELSKLGADDCRPIREQCRRGKAASARRRIERLGRKRADRPRRGGRSRQCSSLSLVHDP